ncbi:response regulator [Spirosoma pulveris]
MYLNPRILLLEDNPANAVELCLALEESVPNVQLAVINDKPGLMDYFRRIEEETHEAPWLVFLSACFLTPTDRMEALSQFRSYSSHASRSSIPVIAIGSFAELATVQALYESGVSAHLIKSDNFQQLVADCQAITAHWFKTAMFPPNASDYT